MLHLQVSNIMDPGSKMDVVYIFGLALFSFVYGQPGTNPLPGNTTVMSL